MKFTYDVIIIGGGIVGLGSALNLLQEKPSLKIAVLEKEKEVAAHQTGHNSGVIHSGIYYKPGSLKALNCIRGYNYLLNFCKEYGVNHELCGKVIVATDKSEIPALENIYKRGLENGLEGLKRINQEEIKEHEPHVAGIDGIYVPQTGIIDYKGVAEKYAEIFQEKGGKVFCSQKVVEINTQHDKSEVVTESTTYETKLVVNCAGLFSDKVAKMTQPEIDLKIIPFRGEYYQLKKEKEYLVKHLIYPVPNPNFPFLGVHYTRMINGGVEAGPNAVLAYKREGYSKGDFSFSELSESLRWRGFQKVATKYWKVGMGELYRSYSKSAFTKALQKLIPEIKKEDLYPGHSGVRAQACDRTGGLLDDFKIYENDKVVNVCNAPSPAATSSLAIGETVAQMILQKI